MTKQKLFDLKISTFDNSIMDKAKNRWDKIAKPLDSLGDFETLVCRISAIQGTVTPSVKKKAIVVACADNGIVEEGVTQSEQEVTKVVAQNLGLGLSSLCTLSKCTGAKIIPVDVGINSDEKLCGVIDSKIAKGTRNFLKEPALLEGETLAGINLGIDMAKALKDEGYDIIAGGEMGIGNTTTSTAVLCTLLDLDSAVLTGRGAGLSDEGLLRKQQVVKEGIEKYRNTYEGLGSKEKAFMVLKNLGGLDLAYLAGLYMGAAIYGLPVVLDGFISVTAAIVAESIMPGAKEYMIASHKGRNEGIEIALKALGLKPFINGNMALGEGTGAALMFPLIDMATDFYLLGTTFAEEKLEDYKRF